MCFIKRVNETDGITYDGSNSLYNLLLYAFQPEKTILDSVRPLYCYRELSGCEPFFFPYEYEHDPDAIFNLMMIYNNAYRTQCNNLAKHRIVSFNCTDYLIPSDLDKLGRSICCTYSKFGYIAAYAVHQDTYHCHIHIIVSTTSYMDGHRFNLKDEKSMLKAIVDDWYAHLGQIIDSDLHRKEFYENALYGDNLRVSSIPLTAKEQIKRNSSLRKSHPYICP